MFEDTIPWEECTRNSTQKITTDISITQNNFPFIERNAQHFPMLIGLGSGSVGVSWEHRGHSNILQS